MLTVRRQQVRFLRADKRDTVKIAELATFGANLTDLAGVKRLLLTSTWRAVTKAFSNKIAESTAAKESVIVSNMPFKKISKFQIIIKLWN